MRVATDPAFGPSLPGGTSAGLAFSNANYTGTNADSAGAGLDRTREGFIEVLEMADLTFTVLAGVSHAANGAPASCAVVRPSPPTSSLIAPSGGLYGTSTIINVANGVEFSTQATALADLARTHYFRPASDPYPAFTAAEIDPVSVVVTPDAVYRDTWTSGLDAVSAVLMREPQGEYVLDASVRAATGVVMTLPTRHAYVTATGSRAPFTGSMWSANCTTGTHEALLPHYFDRETRNAFYNAVAPSPFGAPFSVCGSVMPHVVTNVASVAPTDILGSNAQTVGGGIAGGSALTIDPSFSSGYVQWQWMSQPTITSSPASTKTDIATGVTITGPHTFSGLPVVGYMVTTLTNGFLQCGTSLCRGNYGNSIPFTYRRTITP